MQDLMILLDMDGPLADFVGGACRIHGWDRKQLEAVWPVGTYDIIKPMGLTPALFREKIDTAGEAFWLGLEPTPWFDDLVILLGGLVGNNWRIVTDPSLYSSSFAGKVEWIRRHLGRNFKRFLFTNEQDTEPSSDKTLLAKPGSLLIDDKEKTVRDFIRAGGDGIVFPCWHNSLYRFRGDPLFYVSEFLTIRERTDDNTI